MITSRAPKIVIEPINEIYDDAFMFTLIRKMTSLCVASWFAGGIDDLYSIGKNKIFKFLCIFSFCSLSFTLIERVKDKGLKRQAKKGLKGHKVKKDQE